MTPALNTLKNANIAHSVHEFIHDAGTSSYGTEAVDKLALPAAQVFKTLVIKLDQTQLAIAILPVLNKLNMKAAAKAFGSKKAEMADQQEVQRSTGYVLGGVSPIGQKKVLPTVIDQSAKDHKVMYISGGRRGLEIALNPTDLLRLTRASFQPICQ